MNTLNEYFMAMKDNNEQKIIFINDHEKVEEILYGDFYNEVLKYLAYLKESDLPKGEKVIIQCYESRGVIVALWALILGGMIPIMLPVIEKKSDLNRMIEIIKDFKINNVIADNSHKILFSRYLDKINIIDIDKKSEVINDINIEIPDNNEVALVQFSSGSTGSPKGIPLTHYMILENISAFSKRLNITSHDSTLNWLPLNFDLALIAFHIAPIVNGMNQVLISTKCFLQKPLKWLDYLTKYKITVTNSPNFGLVHVLECIDKSKTYNWNFEKLRILIDSAEPININVNNNVYECLRKYNFKENIIKCAYGLAEACLAVTINNDSNSEKSLAIDRSKLDIGDKVNADENGIDIANLGSKLDGVEIKIIDRESNELSDGRIGYVLIKGKYVISRYFSTDDEEFDWLRTGDIGFLKDGYLYIVDREKDVFFINGSNHYLSDIERVVVDNVLAVNETAACVMYDEEDEKDKIYLFVKKNSSKIDNEKIKSLIKKENSVQIEEVYEVDDIPKTKSGKVIRNKLPELIHNREKTKIEANIIGILKNECGIKEEVSKEDAFIELGLDSLSCINLISELEDIYKVELSFDILLSHPTISELGEYIVSSPKVNHKIKNDESNSVIELTEIQKAYVHGENKYMPLGKTDTFFYIEFKSKLDVYKLQEVFRSIVKENDIFRTVLNISENLYVKEYEDFPEDYFTISDISANNNQQSFIEDERIKLKNSRFDLQNGPLFKIESFKLNDSASYLIMKFNLLIFDAETLCNLLELLKGKYIGNVLPQNNRYINFINSYKEKKNNEEYNKQKEFYLQKFKDKMQYPNIPLLKNIEDVKDNTFSQIKQEFNLDRWLKIEEYAQKNNVTVNSVLLTLYGIVLARWSTLNEFVINIPKMNIDENITKRSLCNATSNILVEFKNDNNKLFLDKVREIQSEINIDLRNDLYEGVEIINELNRTSKKNLILPVVFTSLLSKASKDIDFNFIGEKMYSISQTSQVILDFQVIQTTDYIQINWDYVDELIDRKVIEDMFKNLVELINQIIDQNDIKNIELDDEIKFYKKYNDTENYELKGDLKDLLGYSFKTFKDKPAISDGCNNKTYEELSFEIEDICNKLIENGVKKGDRVCVVARRNVDTISQLLAVIKAGGVYVPLDPDMPQNRKEYILRDSRCNYILEDKNIQIIGVSDVKSFNKKDLDLAYIIYTSGSTGEPKGVCISSKSLVNTLLDINNKFNIDNKDKILQVSPMNFDLSIYDIFGTLINGGYIRIAEETKDIDNLVDIISKEEITVWNSVPSIIKYVSDKIDAKKVLSIRLILLSGDWIKISLANKLKRQFPNARIISLGGATEASIWSIYYEIKAISEKWSSIPYGHPLANQKIYVLKDNMKNAPFEVEGEIYIGGIGLANGYTNENLTKQSFIDTKDCGRIYKTGDYGIMHRNGELELIGRIDNEVKVNGYRINKAEIENALLKIQGIKEVVIHIKNNKILVGYTANREISDKDIKDKLLDMIPIYMIPNGLFLLDEIPITANGKIDMKVLEKIFDSKVKKDSTSYTAVKDEIEGDVLEIVRKCLNEKGLQVNDDFVDYGADSVSAFNILTEINKKYNIEIEIRDLITKSTVKDLSGLITAKLKNR